ncbi:unnamed protein product [Chironomus riparius]|uniref:Cytochrome P450 n=1 Tax=Chironomus riparius TaxID=315576 RepID=A0A9N9RJD1_9DIPT|nr:unnamed protein product [Chironomus riparius]
MILELFLAALYILFIYFKVFRGSYIWFDNNGEVKRRKKSKFWNILTTMYDYLLHTKPEDRLLKLRGFHKVSPRFFRVKFWKIDYVVIYDPELLKKVFNSQVACQRPFRNCFQLEKGLLSSEYHSWKKSRKLLNGGFNLNILKGLIPIFSYYTGTLIKEMEQHLDGKEFDLLLPLSKLTTNGISGTIMNVTDVEVTDLEKLIAEVAIFLDLTCKRMLYPFLEKDWIYRWTKSYKREQEAREYAMAYGDELIAASKKRNRKDKSLVDENGSVIVKRDEKVEFIIDQLLNHEEKFTDEEIRDHVMTLLATSSETTTRFVATTLLQLAINQQYQQKVYEEIVDVFGDSIENIDYDKLNACRYLEMVLKEVLRLFTSVPIYQRETIDKLDIGIGKPLDKGAKIIIFAYILHRRKDLWGKNSGVFDPENFSSERTAERDPYCYLPFGAGPRNCIGNRFAMIAAKTEIIRLLHAYKFSTKIKDTDIKQGLSLTSRLSVDYLMSIEKR